MISSFLKLYRLDEDLGVTSSPVAFGGDFIMSVLCCKFCLLNEYELSRAVSFFELGFTYSLLCCKSCLLNEYELSLEEVVFFTGLSSKLCMKIFLGYFRKTSRVPYVEMAQCFRPIAYRHRPLLGRIRYCYPYQL